MVRVEATRAGSVTSFKASTTALFFPSAFSSTSCRGFPALEQRHVAQTLPEESSSLYSVRIARPRNSSEHRLRFVVRRMRPRTYSDTVKLLVPRISPF
ncbi:hypothetical protein EJ06DRAFT_529931 [Trichodelitschia bisporula]|uniref:Uncharacterized protein n=1 Tax=Trichodelitschia bisporula TaxID=703511 RepID=A0A6G1HY18_9PEZI|nr:hypothetical protein EJ06DRAFT_529931 [Trichodelitschia bisporula]